MHRRLIFQVDANSRIGRGHFSRCQTLYEALKDHFNVVFLVTRATELYLKEKQLWFEVGQIISDVAIEDIVTSEDIVWLDGYEFTEEYKLKVKSLVYLLIETNDTPYPAKHVDVVFNNCPGTEVSQFYNTNTKSRPKVFLGLDYVLVRKAFLKYAKENKVQTKGTGVFLCLGGSDMDNLGAELVMGLLERDFEGPIHWVKGTNDQDDFYDKRVHTYWNLSHHEMIKTMLSSKLLLLPASVLSYEAIALRKPFYVFLTAENQKNTLRGLINDRLAFGGIDIRSKENRELMLNEFLTFYEHKFSPKPIIQRHKNAIDGFSHDRLVTILTELS